MPAIIGKDTKLTTLFPGPALVQLTNACTVAIHRSLGQQTMRNTTQDEVKRRFNICVNAAIEMRGELKWGMNRICDALPEVLRTELSGVKWAPSAKERSCWMPQDGAV